MAGAGVRLFLPGEVLTASLVNTFLQDQVVARFTNAAARDGAFGGEGEPTLEEGRVCYLDSTNELQFYNGTSWVSISAEAISGVITSKGDLVAGTAPNTVVRVGVGSDGSYLVADASTESGVAWAAFVLPDNSVTSAKIVDGTIVNADVNAAAAIAYSKLNIANSVATTDLATGAPRAGFRSTRNAQTGTTYTLALSDLGALVELNNASPVTLTAPLESSVAFAVGDRIDIVQTGVGQVTVAGAGSTTGSTISVTNSGTGSYLIDGASNATIPVVRGATYTFQVNATGHPFWIQTSSGAYNAANVVTSGITNNGTASGTITYQIPYDAPDTLYYACQFHSSMAGSIAVGGVTLNAYDNQLKLNGKFAAATLIKRATNTWLLIGNITS